MILSATELAHVVPLSPGAWDTGRKKYANTPAALVRDAYGFQIHHVAKIWTTLRRLFSRIQLRKAFQINDPSTLMNLSEVAHKAFGSFQLAFEPLSPDVCIPTPHNCWHMLTCSDRSDLVQSLQSGRGILPNSRGFAEAERLG